MILFGLKCEITIKLNNDHLEIVDRYKFLGATFAGKRITNSVKGLGLASSITIYKLLFYI